MTGCQPWRLTAWETDDVTTAVQYGEAGEDKGNREAAVSATMIMSDQRCGHEIAHTNTVIPISSLDGQMGDGNTNGGRLTCFRRLRVVSDTHNGQDE